MKAKDLTGQKFGMLTVIHKVENSGTSKWLCHCDCGNEKEIFGTNLINGKTKSCGCMRLKHGESRSKLYNIHAQMVKIGISEEWKNYNVFRDWAIANDWKEGVKIKRIDVEKPYSSDNCKIV